MRSSAFRLLFLLMALVPGIAEGQRHEILDNHIASLQVVAGQNWTSIPVITMGEGIQQVHIGFDDMTHEYHRYTYKVEHLEADWTESRDVFASDYIDGFQEGNTIEPVGESFNTNTLYTHYALTLPNSKCRMKMSGNYCVTICDDDNQGQPVARAYFMVQEPRMSIQMNVTPATDIDFNHAHQQVEMNLNYGNINVTAPQQQVKTVVLQNGRWTDARVNAKPQFVMSDGLRWTHCKDYIFNGGNEYRKFEALDVTHTTMGLENMNWDGEEYHAWIWTDEPRPSYVYDESANGSFYIRNSDNNDNDVASEYQWVHFRLKTEQLPGDVYVNGDWTYDRFDDRYKMSYNAQQGIYETKILLKQGYYSYQYLWTDRQDIPQPVPSEGNFHQTENQYQALVYFRGPTDRTDRLVGYQQYQYKP